MYLPTESLSWPGSSHHGEISMKDGTVKSVEIKIILLEALTTSSLVLGGRFRAFTLG